MKIGQVLHILLREYRPTTVNLVSFLAVLIPQLVPSLKELLIRDERLLMIHLKHLNLGIIALSELGQVIINDVMHILLSLSLYLLILSHIFSI